MKLMKTMQHVGATSYILLCLLGLQIPILLVIFHFVAARVCDPATVSG